jgi:putative endonuclease
MYFVYILKNEFGWTYVGQTNNLEDRLRRHNSGLVRSTKSRIPLKIVHQEIFETRSQSMKKEKDLKGGQGREWIKKML